MFHELTFHFSKINLSSVTLIPLQLRKLIVTIRASPQRREKFTFQCRIFELRPKELVLDVRTRWNSTYYMLKRAIELKGV
jgi:hypothetical protein